MGFKLPNSAARYIVELVLRDFNSSEGVYANSSNRGFDSFQRCIEIIKDVVAKEFDKVTGSNPEIGFMNVSPRDFVKGASQFSNPFIVGMDMAATTATYMIAQGGEEERAQSVAALVNAQKTIEELEKTLERIKEEPLILYEIERLTKDKKHAFVKKGDVDLRISAVEKLEPFDEVLLHPKTYQIVERLGKAPLEVSRFAPDTMPNVKWSDIGGLEEAKADLREAIEFPYTHKELFKFYNKTQVKGILLSGPPGCGKTMLGKAAATSLAKLHKKASVRTGFLYIKGPEILDPYVGASEKIIRDIFYDAKRHKEEHGYPAVIFLDEADALLATRGTRNVGIGNTIVPQFLTEMDGLEESGAIIILATNRPDILDPAIVRDGRIDRKVVVARPNEKNGKEILMMNLEKTIIGPDVKIKKLSEEIATLFYSEDTKIEDGTPLRDIVNGAMLANCVHLAVSFAIKRDMENKTQTGIILDDAKAAVERIKQQSKDVQHELHQPHMPMMVVLATPQQHEEYALPNKGITKH